jgi:hypothetical protein
MPSFMTGKRSRRITGAVAGTIAVAAVASAAAMTLPSGSAMASAGAGDARLTVVAPQHAVARAEQGTTQIPGQQQGAFDRSRFSLGELQYEDDLAIAKAAARAAAAQAARTAAAKASAEAAARSAAERTEAAARSAADRTAAAQPAPAQTATQQTAVHETAAQSPATSTLSGSPEQIAQQMLGQFGWTPSQFSCLYPLWEHESGWNPSAENPGSGAYGIPQAMPGSMMASAGADWQTNPAIQIKWGLTYIQSRYGSPCGAWAHEQADNWY